MSKRRKVIISCAITGGIHTPTMSPYLPVTPDEIATQAIEAAQAGASILHLHARNPENGRPIADPDVYMQFLPRIKAGCNAIVNITTGGGLGMTIEERLAAALVAKPEMSSLNMGSMNFGIFPMAAKYQNWQSEWEKPFLDMTRNFIFRNTFTDIEEIVGRLGTQFGTRFEFECYDVGHLYNLAHFVDSGLIKPPFFIQTIFGILGGIGAEVDHLVHMRNTALRLFGEEHEWSVFAAGKFQQAFCTHAALMGGNLRVGLEDSLYIAKGQLAQSNAQQVQKLRTIIESLSLEIATPDEVRERLQLKGADNVGF